MVVEVVVVVVVVVVDVVVAGWEIGRAKPYSTRRLKDTEVNWGVLQ